MITPGSPTLILKEVKEKPDKQHLQNENVI